VANVWDAMKKHQAEEEARKAQAEQDGAGADSKDPAATAPRPDTPTAEAAKSPAKAASRPTTRHSEPANGNGSKYSPMIRAFHDASSSIAEEYRALRINLTSDRSDGKLCCLITSAKAGEGKTVTCANLAVVLAERDDRKTIVVDGDVRKGTLSSELFGLPREPGLADVLKGTLSFKDAIRRTAYPNLFILPSGRAGKDQCGQLLVRPELEDMVNQLRRQYDYILFDTPPIGTNIPDAGMIGRAVGQAIVVVRMNHTRRESVEGAIRQLHGAKVEVSGLVLTHRTFAIPKLLYGGSGKGYDYYHHDYK